jgi:hypothetical protein
VISVYGTGHSSRANDQLSSQAFVQTYLQTTLFLCTIIDTGSDNVPSGIYIRQEATESRTSSCQSELEVSSKLFSRDRKRTMIGATGTRASYTLLASFTFQAWKVIWRQQHPIPKAIASILI